MFKPFVSFFVSVFSTKRGYVTTSDSAGLVGKSYYFASTGDFGGF